MTYEQWWDTYNPIQNHIEANASFDGAMFETYGPELSFVRDQDISKVWTIIEGEDGNLYVSDGYHFVNRIGYFVTERPFTGDGFLEVPIYDDEEMEEMNRTNGEG